MDLTSAPRALASLERRQVPATDLEASKAILQVLSDKPVTSTTTTDPVAPTHPLDAHIEQLNTLFSSDKWESKAAGFISAEALLRTAQLQPTSALKDVTQAAMRELEHREPRVRSAVVGLLFELSRADATGTWSLFGDRLLAIVHANLTMDVEERQQQQDMQAPDSDITSTPSVPASSAEAVAQHASTAMSPVAPSQEPSSENPSVPSSSGSVLSEKPRIVHETVGWKALETSLKSLDALIRGYGPAFNTDGHATDELLQLVTQDAPNHQNRYVREVAQMLCGALALCVIPQPSSPHRADDSIPQQELPESTMRLVRALSDGLGDNWSQVRYAASCSVRALAVGLGPKRTAQGECGQLLVPRMCLNRYYLAEGVRIYSQETWKLVFGDMGPQVVAQRVADVVAFYCSQSEADNHGVREAACHCIAELARQVDSAVVDPHVPKLLSALVACFRDESWPVRDAACLACGKFVLACAESSRGSLDELVELWFAHLWDNTWSVREDSAVAIGMAMQAYPTEQDGLIARVEQQLVTLLHKVEEQQQESSKSSASKDADTLSTGMSNIAVDASADVSKEPPVSPRGGIVAASGTLADLRDRGTKDERHTDQQMFSCGSLAPKLRRGVGCMDHGFSRNKEAWEATDGGVYLLRELTTLHASKGEVYMPLLAEAARRASGFRNDHVLQETIWKQLPSIGRGLGKRVFKRHLESFLEPLVRSLGSSNQLASHAAAFCVRDVRAWVGPEVFKGRVMEAMNGEWIWQKIMASPLC